ncbi:MAG: hypothetical protein JRN15_24085, partial [Nitrososphaerota archaeon]|nr:hypothetical protein [Nitrososphaerota archaeon]
HLVRAACSKGAEFVLRSFALNEYAKNIASLAMRSLFRHDVQSANAAIIEYGKLSELEEKVDAQMDKKLMSAVAVATPLKSIASSIKQIARYYIIASETIINRAVETSTEITEVVSEE